MGLLRLKNIEYWACISGLVLGGLLSLILKYAELSSFSTIEKAPILMQMSFPIDNLETDKALIVSKFRNTLEDINDIIEVKVFKGQADIKDLEIDNIYNSEVLFELIIKEQQSSTLNKNQLISKLNMLAANAYPGVYLKLIQGTTHPAVLVKDTYSIIQLNFIPNQHVLGQMGIEENELNRQLEAHIRLAPKGASLENIQNFRFVWIANGQSIPFNTLGEFKQIKVEYKLKDIPAGHWEPIVNAMHEGIIIGLSLVHMDAVGLRPLADIEIKIEEELKSLGQDADLESVGQILLVQDDDFEIKLKDIARIELGFLDSNESYSIHWQE